MSTQDWRARAGAPFTCEKRPAHGARGMVVTNHPLASAAGAEMLAAGGNAIDAAIAAFFTLTVVEPMMVGILGGGMAHIRLADGTHTRHRRPEHRAAGDRADDLYAGPERPARHDGDDRPASNAIGPTAVAAPGNLMGWCEALTRFGTFPLADVMEPAIRHASRGFRVTPYLSANASPTAPPTWRSTPRSRALYLPGGAPITPGTRLVTGAYAETLRAIAKEGPGLLYGGALGELYADRHGEAPAAT